jgi:hypothetical protein
MRVDAKEIMRMENFWNKFGVSAPHRLRLALIPDAIFHDTAKLTDKIEQLKGVLGPRVDVLKMITRYPRLLKSRSETLSLNLEYLCDLFSLEDNLRFVERYPRLLCRDVKFRVKTNLDTLQRLLEGSDVLRVVWRQPDLLCRSMDTIETNLRQLRTLLDTQNVSSLIEKQPSLLCSDVDHSIRPKFEKLKLLFPLLDVRELVFRQPSLLWSDIDTTLASKLWYLHFHVPPVELNALIGSDPRILTRGFAVLARLDFLRLEYPSLTISPRSVVNMPACTFYRRFPTFRQYMIQRLLAMDPSHRSLTELELEDTAALQRAMNLSLKRVMQHTAPIVKLTSEDGSS